MACALEVPSPLRVDRTRVKRLRSMVRREELRVQRPKNYPGVKSGSLSNLPLKYQQSVHRRQHRDCHSSVTKQRQCRKGSDTQYLREVFAEHTSLCARTGCRIVRHRAGFPSLRQRQRQPTNAHCVIVDRLSPAIPWHRAAPGSFRCVHEERPPTGISVALCVFIFSFSANKKRRHVFAKGEEE